MALSLLPPAMEHSVTGRPCSAAAKDLVGIGAALIDLHAAVAAGQAAHADAPGSPLRGDALDGNGPGRTSRLRRS